MLAIAPAFTVAPLVIPPELTSRKVPLATAYRVPGLRVARSDHECAAGINGRRSQQRWRAKYLDRPAAVDIRVLGISTREQVQCAPATDVIVCILAVRLHGHDAAGYDRVV